MIDYLLNLFQLSVFILKHTKNLIVVLPGEDFAVHGA